MLEGRDEPPPKDLKQAVEPDLMCRSERRLSASKLMLEEDCTGERCRSRWDDEDDKDECWGAPAAASVIIIGEGKK